MPPHKRLVVRDRNARSRLLPLLREQVFHVSPLSRLAAIETSGAILCNRGGALGDLYPQSRISIARQRGYVCLFDLRQQGEDAIRDGLDCFGFPTAGRFGNGVACFILKPEATAGVVIWNDIRAELEIGAFHIPNVESWFPGDLPLSHVESIVCAELIRRRDA